MNHQDVPPRPSTPPASGTPSAGGGSNPVGGPNLAPAADAPRLPNRALNRTTLWKVFFAVVLLLVVGGLVWLALWLNSGRDSNGSTKDGALETAVTPAPTALESPKEGVEPAGYALGDCFRDFDPEALTATVVPCTTGHSAQLVSLYRYPGDGTYPGSDALKAKAQEACQAARLSPAADGYTLEFQRSYPSSTSWASGDRRVDCYVTAATGNVINASVLP